MRRERQVNRCSVNRQNIVRGGAIPAPGRYDLAPMSPPVLESALVQRCEELARPLYVGLDGVQTFDRVDRVRSRIELLAARETVEDPEILEILVIFHAVADRLGTMAPAGRFDLFLGGLGLDESRRRLIRGGLKRYEEAPATPEERLLHDAALLEQAGVLAAVERLLAAGRKRLPARRVVGSLDPGPAPERFATRVGADWASREQASTRRWLEDLRRRFEAGAPRLD